jgi:hypothetical protein
MPDPLNGRYAAVKIGTALIQNLGKWSVDIKMDEIDVSVFGSVWGKKIPGVQSWTGSLDGFYDPADTTGQKVLSAAALAATKVTNMRFYIDSTSYWCPDVTADSGAGAYISSVSISHDKAGVASLTMSVIGFGPLLLV